MMALPRSARLRDGRQIRAVSRSGTRARAGDLSFTVLLGTSEGRRAAVVVGRRAGGAVERNRQRRRLQHAVGRVLAVVPDGTDVVVRAGSEVSRLSPAALDDAVRSGVRRAVERAAR